jgi:hypothetical protein
MFGDCLYLFVVCPDESGQQQTERCYFVVAPGPVSTRHPVYRALRVVHGRVYMWTWVCVDGVRITACRSLTLSWGIKLDPNQSQRLGMMVCLSVIVHPNPLSNLTDHILLMRKALSNLASTSKPITFCGYRCQLSIPCFEISLQFCNISYIQHSRFGN